MFIYQFLNKYFVLYNSRLHLYKNVLIQPILRVYDKHIRTIKTNQNKHISTHINISTHLHIYKYITDV